MSISLKKDVSKIELHYFFSDTSHSITALIRNKCELNLLGIFKEITSILGARIQVEAEAHTPGGLIDYYLLRGKSDFSRSITAAIFHYVLPLEVDIEKAVNDEDKDEIRKRVDKLRKELKESEREDANLIDMNNVAVLFRNNLKIIKLKSNFFRQLNNSEKVTKLSVQQIMNDNNAVGKPNVINRKKFDTYMLVADTLKPETDQNAIIEIISPVLKVGNYKWKGIYKSIGRTVNFVMKDEDFKNEVINQGTLFKNGTRIECKLEITRKMSEFGEVTVTGYSVTTVSKKLDGDASADIVHARPVKKKKEAEQKQLDLFGTLFS